MNFILAKAFTPIVCMILFGMALSVSHAVGQEKTPEVLPVSTRVYDQLRVRSLKRPIQNKKPGAIIETGFVVNDSWVVANVAMQKAVKLKPNDPSSKDVWHTTNSRVFVIDLNNGKVSQVAIKDQGGKSNLLIKSNFTILGKNVIGITVEQQKPFSDAGPNWEKTMLHFMVGTLNNKTSD